MSKQLYPESVVTADVDGVVRWALNAHPDDTSVGAITSRYMAESNLLKEFEGRTLNADEQRKHDRIEKDVEKLASAAAKLSERLVERREALAEARKLVPADTFGNPATPRGLRAEGTYRPDEAGVSFFRDVVNATRDPLAQERLRRNQLETMESRDVTTGSTPSAGGFVPPAYLGDLWAALPRASRPFADRVPKMPLPDAGTVVTIPKVQSGVTVASQDGENQNVSETDLDSEQVTANLVTIAGHEPTSASRLWSGRSPAWTSSSTTICSRHTTPRWIASCSRARVPTGNT